MPEELVEQIPTAEDLFAQCYIGSDERVGGELSEEERIRVHRILNIAPPLGQSSLVTLSRVEPTPDNPTGLRTKTWHIPTEHLLESIELE